MLWCLVPLVCAVSSKGSEQPEVSPRDRAHEVKRAPPLGV